ncbi:hypothetical protein JTB14_013057 [Gonioctena quinquepunctata]|nr:hypothetical protein JTB14_013057 [Gonioctena quinquepunctata]
MGTGSPYKRCQREAEVSLFLCFHQDVPLIAFVAASCYRLVPLPVEIWSTILRSLDSLSLLATARADPVCLDICRGDALLKKMLREGIRMEKTAASTP